MDMHTFHAQYSLDEVNQDDYLKSLKQVAQRAPARMEFFKAVPGWDAWPTETARA